jgi:Cgr1 family
LLSSARNPTFFKKSRRKLGQSGKNHNGRNGRRSKYFVSSDRFFGAIKQWQSIRKKLEISESSNGVSSRVRQYSVVLFRPYTSVPEGTLANVHRSISRRSHLQRGVKTTSWETRKERDTKAAAIKALQKVLKDEKAAELQRFAVPYLNIRTR